MMWYVIQVKVGTEEQIVVQCRKIIGRDVLKDCFIPYCECMKKYGGEWHKEKRILFSGYVFMISDDLEKLYLALKRVVGLTKLIRTGEEVVPLSVNEIEFLKRFGGKEQVVQMSNGFIEGDRIVVISGPLVGNEGCIKRINRHKRKAYLEVEIFGRKVETQVGLEIIDKRG